MVDDVRARLQRRPGALHALGERAVRWNVGDRLALVAQLLKKSALVGDPLLLKQHGLVIVRRQGDRASKLAQIERRRVGAAQKVHQIGSGVEANAVVFLHQAAADPARLANRVSRSITSWVEKLPILWMPSPFQTNRKWSD